MRGRYPAGVEFIDKLDGSAQSKQRLKAILDTLAGEQRLLQACRRLGIGGTRFHRLREQAMQGALTAIEPRPPGRRSKAASVAEQVGELEQALAEARLQVQQAQLREEIALILPHAAADGAGKKTRRPSVKLRKRKPR
jgi:hypothetical protein